MQNAFRKFFAPPVFPQDEDKTHSAANVNTIGWSIIVIALGTIVFRTIQGQDARLVEVNLVLTSIIIALLLILYLSRKGYVKAASVLLVSIIWLGLSLVPWIADGIRDVTFFGYAIPILMAGLLLGWRGASVVTVASIVSGWALAYAETNHLLKPTLDTPLHFARDVTFIFILIGVLIYRTISSLQNTIKRSQTTAQELALSNKELNVLRVDLEQRVQERTSELQKRATQLEAVSTVARTIASVQDIETLLPSVTKLVSEQFGFYHVGIFLLDERREKAILRASNSEGGQQMIKRQHNLPLNLYSIVGYAASRGEPRIALDVGVDSAYLNNPDLPSTRSEMALPLRVAGQVIGVLDVQSTETNAFSQEDISLLAILADQVAIAIANARLFGEAQKALSESRELFEKYTKQEWTNFVRQVRQTGFIFDGKQVTPLDNHAQRQSTKTVIQTGSLSLEKESASIAVPIKLRGQTIGVLDVRSKKGERQWKQDEITLLQAAAERAALALENARLVENAQRRAARERAIGDISAKIGSVSNLESILQTAVEELGRKIGGATEVSLEINSDDGQSNH